MPRNPELEHDIQNDIRLWCGEHNLLAFRVNTGSGYTPDGRRFSTGVPSGFPDVIVLTNNGQIIFVECKAKYGRLRPDQKTLHDELRKRKFAVLVPKNLEHFISELKEVMMGE